MTNYVKLYIVLKYLNILLILNTDFLTMIRCDD